MTAQLQYWKEKRRAGGWKEKKSLELMEEDGWMVM